MTDQESELGGLGRILQYLETPEPVPEKPIAEFDSQASVPVRPRYTTRLAGKRSKKACATCRSRKVRCNVVAHGVPCSNCQHDEVECTIPSKYKRIPTKAAFSFQGSTESPDDGLNENLDMTEDWQDLFGAVQQHTSPKNKWSGSEDCSMIGSCEPGALSILPSARTMSWIQSPLASGINPVFSPHPGSSLSQIFTPFPAHFGAREFTYLKSHDALTLPSEEFQVELLKAYVEFVHGTLPVLDLADFLTIVKFGNERNHNTTREKSPAQQVSLLLFQAVMFAAVGYVSYRVLKEAGFESRQNAKKTFFNRVKLLYNFDICPDRLTTLQSLLLMTLCPTNRTSGQIIKDAGHWLDIAISLAYVLGLNRDIPSQAFHTRRKRLERRIWWIAFIRDRTLSLRSSFGLRRRAQIAKEDSHIKMLSLEDFDLEESAARYEGIDELRMKVIAVDCVEKAMMCWCVNEDLISRCSTYSSMDSQLFLPLYQNHAQMRARSISAKSHEITNIQLRKDEQPVLLATHFRRSQLFGQEKAEIFLEIDLDKGELFRSSSGDDIISEYDDYFEYLQNPMEKNDVETTHLSGSDDPS